MQILTAGETARALPWSELVPALARAARELAGGAIRAPVRQVVPADGGVLLTMPAIAADLGVAKVITVHPGNARHGLPAIQGEVLVFEAATGRRRALLDGPTVTARRTAAVTLLGIACLAPRPPASALIVGTGAQATAHADALVEHLGIRAVRVAGIDLPAAEEFCRALRARHPAVAASACAASALAGEAVAADVVVSLTTARAPVVPATLAAHTLAIGVGAFTPEMAELPPALLHARRVVVDELAAAREEAGDLLQAGVDWSRVVPLAAALDGAARGGASAPVLKTVGHAAWDLAAARVAVARLGAAS
jgi:1-piperideine-2-carboxylate/1-pyrroline-2-carboxylate reductase [NAD(P)H]